MFLNMIAIILMYFIRDILTCEPNWLELDSNINRVPKFELNKIEDLTLISNEISHSAIWNNKMLDIKDGYKLELKVEISSNIKLIEGFAIIFQNSERGMNSIGDSDSGLGYSEMDNTFAIEFDYKQSYEKGDPNFPHISFIYNSGINYAEHINALITKEYNSLLTEKSFIIKILYYPNEFGNYSFFLFINGISIIQLDLNKKTLSQFFKDYIIVGFTATAVQNTCCIKIIKPQLFIRNISPSNSFISYEKSTLKILNSIPININFKDSCNISIEKKLNSKEFEFIFDKEYCEWDNNFLIDTKFYIICNKSGIYKLTVKYLNISINNTLKLYINGEPYIYKIEKQPKDNIILIDDPLIFQFRMIDIYNNTIFNPINNQIFIHIITPNGTILEYDSFLITFNQYLIEIKIKANQTGKYIVRSPLFTILSKEILIICRPRTLTNIVLFSIEYIVSEELIEKVFIRFNLADNNGNFLFPEKELHSKMTVLLINEEKNTESLVLEGLYENDDYFKFSASLVEGINYYIEIKLPGDPYLGFEEQKIQCKNCKIRSNYTNKIDLDYVIIILEFAVSTTLLTFPIEKPINLKINEFPRISVLFGNRNRIVAKELDPNIEINGSINFGNEIKELNLFKNKLYLEENSDKVSRYCSKKCDFNVKIKYKDQEKTFLIPFFIDQIYYPTINSKNISFYPTKLTFYAGGIHLFEFSNEIYLEFYRNIAINKNNIEILSNGSKIEKNQYNIIPNFCIGCFVLKLFFTKSSNNLNIDVIFKELELSFSVIVNVLPEIALSEKTIFSKNPEIFNNFSTIYLKIFDQFNNIVTDKNQIYIKANKYFKNPNVNISFNEKNMEFQISFKPMSNESEIEYEIQINGRNFCLDKICLFKIEFPEKYENYNLFSFVKNIIFYNDKFTYLFNYYPKSSNIFRNNISIFGILNSKINNFTLKKEFQKIKDYFYTIEINLEELNVLGSFFLSFHSDLFSYKNIGEIKTILLSDKINYQYKVYNLSKLEGNFLESTLKFGISFFNSDKKLTRPLKHSVKINIPALEKLYWFSKVNYDNEEEMFIIDVKVSKIGIFEIFFEAIDFDAKIDVIPIENYSFKNYINIFNLNCEFLNIYNMSIGYCIKNQECEFYFSCLDRYYNKITEKTNENIDLILEDLKEAYKIKTDYSIINSQYIVKFRPKSDYTTLIYFLINGTSSLKYNISLSFTPKCPLSLPYNCPFNSRCVKSYYQCELPITQSFCPLESPFFCQNSNNFACLESQLHCDCPKNYKKYYSRCFPQNISFETIFPIEIGQCPHETPIRCKTTNFLCRTNINLCPSLKVCFPGSFKCIDDSCVQNMTQCPKLNICPDNYKLCFSDMKTCVLNNIDCPSEITCPEGYIVCTDGSCQENEMFCNESDDYKIQKISCGPFYSLCQDRRCHKECGKDIIFKSNYNIVCPELQILCPDYSCRNSINDCPFDSKNTSLKIINECSLKYPLKCPNSYCISDYNKRKECISIKCPLYRNIICSNGLCVRERDECINQLNELKPLCPHYLPKACPFELYSCRKEYSHCPSLPNCPIEFPYFCKYYSQCVISLKECPLRNPCPPNYVHCLDGSCSNFLCSTQSTCTDLFPYKCLDGSCRKLLEDCPTIKCSFPSLFYCQTSNNCTDSPLNCISNHDYCPFFMPIRCPDGSCKPFLDWCSNSNLIIKTQIEILCPYYLPYKCTDGACVSNKNECLERNSTNFECIIRCPKGLCTNSYGYCGLEENLTKSNECNFNKIACSNQHYCVDSCFKCPNFYLSEEIDSNSWNYPEKLIFCFKLQIFVREVIECLDETNLYSNFSILLKKDQQYNFTILFSKNLESMMRIIIPSGLFNKENTLIFNCINCDNFTEIKFILNFTEELPFKFPIQLFFDSNNYFFIKSSGNFSIQEFIKNEESKKSNKIIFVILIIPILIIIIIIFLFARRKKIKSRETILIQKKLLEKREIDYAIFRNRMKTGFSISDVINNIQYNQNPLDESIDKKI